jgi:hypothetical protein
LSPRSARSAKHVAALLAVREPLRASLQRSREVRLLARLHAHISRAHVRIGLGSLFLTLPTRGLTGQHDIFLWWRDGSGSIACFLLLGGPSPCRDFSTYAAARHQHFRGEASDRPDRAHHGEAESREQDRRDSRIPQGSYE